jgi:hypothetical protein
MVKRKQVFVAVAAAVAVLAGLYAWSRLSGTASPGAAERVATARAGQGESVARIDLARLDRPADAAQVGGRDLFAFGAPPPPPAPPPTLAPPPVTQAAALAPGAPVPPPLVPLNLKYIGSLDAPQGVKVAFFMNDQKEVVMGQVGDTVMNRFKVMKIGLESADVQMVGSEQLQRIPLRAN